MQWLPGRAPESWSARSILSLQLILLSVRLDFLRKHGSNLVFAHELFQERSLLFPDPLLKFAVPRRLNL